MSGGGPLTRCRPILCLYVLSIGSASAGGNPQLGTSQNVGMATQSQGRSRRISTWAGKSSAGARECHHRHPRKPSTGYVQARTGAPPAASPLGGPILAHRDGNLRPGRVMYCPYLQLPLDDPIFGNGVRVLAARPQAHAAVWVRRFRPGPPRRRKRPRPCRDHTASVCQAAARDLTSRAGSRGHGLSRSARGESR